MSTITREFTKEQLQQIIETDHVQCGEASSLARIALASLEAEPVCVIDQSNLDYLKSGSDADVWPASRTEMGDVLLYRSAPPAPVSVPDAIHSQGEKSASDDYYALGWNACRAAMLQGSDGNAQVIPDGWVACSERMPDDDDFVYIWPRPDFGVELHVGQYCECHPKGDGWYAQVHEQNYGIEWCPITVTHWMPLPAAPKQEVNNDQ